MPCRHLLCQTKESKGSGRFNHKVTLTIHKAADWRLQQIQIFSNFTWGSSTGKVDRYGIISESEFEHDIYKISELIEKPPKKGTVKPCNNESLSADTEHIRQDLWNRTHSRLWNPAHRYPSKARFNLWNHILWKDLWHENYRARAIIQTKGNIAKWLQQVLYTTNTHIKSSITLRSVFNDCCDCNKN